MMMPTTLDDAHNVGWSEAGGTPSFPSMAVTAPMPLPRRIENPPLTTRRPATREVSADWRLLERGLCQAIFIGLLVGINLMMSGFAYLFLPMAAGAKT